MSKRMFANGLLVCLALLLLVPTPSLAMRGEEGDWEIGPYVGFGFLDDYKTLSPKDNALYGVRVGYFFTRLLSLEGSYQRLSTDTQFSPLPGVTNRDVDLDSLRLNLLFNLRPGEKMRPFFTVGLGSESTEVNGIVNEDDLGFNFGGGARWFFGERFGIRVDGRLVSTDVGGAVDAAQRNIEATVGALWTFGGGRLPDDDGDGVADDLDACPSTPRGAAVDKTGCPSDNDGDGVFDGIDRCLDTPRAVAVDRRGCAADNDGDGINDANDQCAETPRGAEVDPAGCPRDADSDGVFDGLDRCPDTPRAATIDRDGCPYDRDGDGVSDGLDRCPNTPRDAEVDANGCPEPGRSEPIVPSKKPLVLEGVTFLTDSASLTQASYASLDQVAASLLEWPEIRVEIGGHTDSTGDERHNLKLSTSRAQTVRDYLVRRGVEPRRLVVRGYGAGRPIDDNRSREGRARNRRVELTKIK